MYMDIIRRLRDMIRRSNPKEGEPTVGFVLHNNAPTHRSVSVKDFLAESNVTALEYPLTWLKLIFTCSLY
jgi:3-dehydroquinate dehydratase